MKPTHPLPAVPASPRVHSARILDRLLPTGARLPSVRPWPPCTA
jgi:hypothetical protein